jgi:hypothetical protein
MAKAAVTMAHNHSGDWQAGLRRYILRHRFKTGRHAVDLALKYDVLAVCAVFGFVGAILLGAF